MRRRERGEVLPRTTESCAGGWEVKGAAEEGVGAGRGGRRGGGGGGGTSAPWRRVLCVPLLRPLRLGSRLSVSVPPSPQYGAPTAAGGRGSGPC